MGWSRRSRSLSCCALPVTTTVAAWFRAGASRALILLLPMSAGACDGGQSAFNTAGAEAERVLDLFWIMLAGAVFVWIAVIGTAVYAVRMRRGRHDQAIARWFLLGGGVAFPIVVLGALLSYGLFLMSALRPPGASLSVLVVGEQWWWNVQYRTGQGATPIRTANEIRVPVGEPVEFILQSRDVIHSFWIPPLGGKMDMIPGRTTRLTLEPTRAGLFRGACAEFCGDSHALMAFSVRAMEPPAFERWLSHEASPAAEPTEAQTRLGAALFRDVGCGGCHAIRGTSADGRIGPDLTHLASRATLAAGVLPMTEPSLARWITDPKAIKPGARMPAFGVLGVERIAAIAAYLAILK